mgnify:CR=1 FL=1
MTAQLAINALIPPFFSMAIYPCAQFLIRLNPQLPAGALPDPGK